MFDRKNKKSNLGKFDLIVAKISINGILSMARPCMICCKRIRLSKIINNVYYTTSDGTLKREKAINIESKHVSSGRKWLMSKKSK